MLTLAAAVLSLAPAPQDPFADVFLPSIEFAKHPVEHWMQEFERSEGTSTGALWCIYYCDRRTEEVVRFLHDWRAKVPDPAPLPPNIIASYPENVAREIEAILIDWDALRDPLPPLWQKQKDGRRIDAPEDELLRWVLLPDSPSGENAGGPWVELPLGLLASPARPAEGNDEVLLTALDSPDRAVQNGAAVALVLRGRHVANVLRALVVRVAQDRQVPGRSWEGGTWRSGGPDYRGFSIGLEPVRERIEAHVLSEWAWTSFVLDWVLRTVGSAAAEPLEEMHASPLEAEAVDRVLRWNGWGPRFSLWGGPLWEPPDRWDRAPGSATPPPMLLFGQPVGEAAMDYPRVDRVLAIGRRIQQRFARHEAFDAEVDELMAELREPYREGGATGPMDWYLTGFEILRSYRISTPAVWDWCLAILRDKEHYRSHVGQALEVLAQVKLDPRRRALLMTMDERWIEPQSRFFAHLGHQSIERAARIRTTAQARQDMGVLADLLRITRPGPHDLTMICTALERGWADDRQRALKVVEQASLDTPPIRERVLAACSDIDDHVRAHAQALVTARGW